MAQAVVSDFVIWTKHIHGDARLAARIAELKAGETVELQVDGVAGPWRKMDNGKDGRPTPGIRPIGRMQAFWRELYGSRRGDVVTVELAEGAGQGSADPGLTFAALARNEFERQAALDALFSLSSSGPVTEAGRSRDDAYDRELDRQAL